MLLIQEYLIFFSPKGLGRGDFLGGCQSYYQNRDGRFTMHRKVGNSFEISRF